MTTGFNMEFRSKMSSLNSRVSRKSLAKKSESNHSKSSTETIRQGLNLVQTLNFRVRSPDSPGSESDITLKVLSNKAKL